MTEPQTEPVKEDSTLQKDTESADKNPAQESEDTKKEETQDVKQTTPVSLESVESSTDTNQDIPKICTSLTPPPSKYIHIPKPRISTPPPLPPLLPPAQPDIFPLCDDAVDEDNNNKKEECADSAMHDSSIENDKTSNPDQDDDYDNDIPDSLYSIDDLTETNADGTEDDGEKAKARIIDTSSAGELACCEYCGGPVKKRRVGSILKKFCSKVCARSCKRIKFKDEEGNGINTTEISEVDTSTGGVISASTVSESEHKMTWDAYLQAASYKAAPESYFKHTTTDVPGLKPGMKLEAVDRNNPPSYCVATVIKCVGHRVCIRYDGYGSDSTNDMWCNYQAEELHPIGWCAKNGYPLQPPKGVNSSLEAWRTFLTQTLTGALAAPQDLFRKSQEHFQPRVHGFEVGMKLEAIHPLRPSIICPATVTKSLGPYYFAVTPDYQHDLPPTTICCHSDSPGIFPIGWCYRNGIELTYPANYSKKTFDWPKYLSICRATAAPSPLFRKVKTHRFRVGMKVEAVDLEQPAVICVATITNVIGRLLLLFFDGQSRFQFVDVEAPDIYPIGWCKRTGHPLVTPFGVMPSNYDAKTRVSESEVLYLPSFDEVMNRQNNALSNTVAILPRKTTIRPEQDKEKDKDKDDSRGDMESEDKSGDSDISEDDPLASERFYHNKNQIFFNKGCCIGPLLNPEQVKLLPDATPPGKVSTVIRTGLEMVAQAALDPEKVIDLMQEGCGVRVTIKHQGKLLKKAISRVDSRPKLERYLKRFCRRLICCEYFLSLKPVGQPCPDTCKSDDQGNLQGPKGLKAKRSREYFEVKHLGFEKKRRGRRRRKTEILLSHPLVMKATSTENGTPIPTVLSSTLVRNRQLAPAYHLQPNGSAMNRPSVATAALPGVQAPVVRQVYPGTPGNVAIVRPNTSLQLPARSHGSSAIAPAQGGQIVIGSMHTSAPLAKQDGVLTNGRTLIMTDVSVSQQGTPKQRIVTNVSGQRFSTSASSGGTTITFVRAPPNVTVCSSLTPPPLTRISDTVESITAEMNTNSSLSPHPIPSPKLTGFTLGSSKHKGSSRGPPNVVVSSMAQVMAVTGVGKQVTETIASQFSTSCTNSSSSSSIGVIRAPIVIPPQVKQETPPPPPLVHASKLSSGVRAMGPGITASSCKVSIVPSSFTQVRSFSHKSIQSPSGQTLYKLGSSSANPTSRTLCVRPEGLKSDSTKHFSPNYQSFSRQRISPKPPSIAQSVVASQSSKAAIARSTASILHSAGHQAQTSITAKKHGVIQTIHHNPASTNASLIHSKAVLTSVKPVQNNTKLDQVIDKMRSNLLRRSLSGHEGRLVKREEDPVKEYNGVEDGVKSAKREAWWLDKKKRRKRSRFSYLPTKYKNEDGQELSDELYLSPDDDGDYYDEMFSYQDKPKRGRISELSDFVMRLDDEEGPTLVDDQDPDWDEREERRKIQQQMKPKKKRMGNKRKDGGSDLVSPTLSNPPSPNLPTHSALPTNSYIDRPSTKPLDNNTQHVLKLDPAPPRRPSSASVDNKDSLSFKGKRSASYTTTEGFSRGPLKSTSSITSPLSPKSPPFKKRKMVDVGVNTSLPGCVNSRSPDLPSNPVTWSVDEVLQYIRSTDCGHYAALFREEEIDGQALLMLSRDALMQFTPMKLGPTLKMCSYISQLRLRAK